MPTALKFNGLLEFWRNTKWEHPNEISLRNIRMEIGKKFGISKFIYNNIFRASIEFGLLKDVPNAVNLFTIELGDIREKDAEEKKIDRYIERLPDDVNEADKRTLANE